MDIFKTKVFDRIIEFIERWYYAFLVVILIIAGFNLFYNLGNIPIDSWDEARHGVNAYEMIKRNNYIVSTYNYKNDYWNLKPPISYWAIVLGYKLFGFNALGLRFVSAMASFITIILIALFSLRKYGKLASLISTIALTTSMPFILDHCARTGDADSLFVLFFTMAMISMSLIEKNIKWLYCAGISFSLAFLAKSWHSGNIVIIGALYLALSKILFKLNIKQICIFLLSSIGPILIWGFFRYSQDGLTFFQNMINYDLLARTSVTLEGHVGSMSFYIEKLQKSYFYWLLVLVSVVLSAALLIKSNERKIRSDILTIVLWIAVPFLLYTKARTKIEWYILPIYPALAVVIGAGSSLFLKCINRNFMAQFLLSFLLLFSIYKNEVSITRMIWKPVDDYAQVALKNIKKMPEYNHKNIYTTFKTNSVDNPNRFNQSYLLCAELYGDLNGVEGGIEGFLMDTTDKALLLIPKNKKTLAQKEKYNLKVVAENKQVFILTK